MIRIYGQFEGESSLSRVGRGFGSVFPYAVRYELQTWGNDLDELEESFEGVDADVGLFVGDLSLLPVTQRSKHRELWAMVAPNSSTVGKLVRDALDTWADVIMTPSEWARGVIRKELPHKKVVCAPHGVAPAFIGGANWRDEETFKVLHLSSSTLSRKGTSELLEGWAKANLPNAQLFVSVPPGKSFHFQHKAEELGISNAALGNNPAFITDRLDYSGAEMSKLYAKMDFVCQPSRGEGFGMVPLEARACGTPVIMTDCTGHSQHASGRGVVIVKTGPDEPIDDFPGAFAPGLRSEDIAKALTYAYEHRKKLSADATMDAEIIRKQWSWSSQLKEIKNEILSRAIHR